MSDVPSPRKKRWKAWLLGLFLLFIGIFVAAELVLRFVYGLGDPPLSMSDPEIEYLFKPSQDVSRFGNQIKYNAYSMRSDDFPQAKQDDEAMRILVLGDSVVNGGNLSDQSELASERLKQALGQKLGAPVVVGNISAGSWGPRNILAYLEKYGLFDADAAVLVLSSHDAADVPTYQPRVGVSPAFPEKKPVLAFEELVFRYLPRYLPGGSKRSSTSVPEKDPDDDFAAIADLESLIGLIQSAGIPLILIQHPTVEELGSELEPGYYAIAELADRMGVVHADVAPYLQSMIDEGQDVYRGHIHLTAEGQEALGQAMLETLGPVIETIDSTDVDG